MQEDAARAALKKRTTPKDHTNGSATSFDPINEEEGEDGESNSKAGKKAQGDDGVIGDEMFSDDEKVKKDKKKDKKDKKDKEMEKDKKKKKSSKNGESDGRSKSKSKRSKSKSKKAEDAQYQKSYKTPGGGTDEDGEG